MTISFTTKTVLDPHKRFVRARPDDLIEAGGLLPRFFHSAVRQNPLDVKHLAELMNEEYGFGGFRTNEKWKGTIAPDGTHYYPGDPPLHPIFHLSSTIHTAGESVDRTFHCFIYQYGFIAVMDGVDPSHYYVARMD